MADVQARVVTGSSGEVTLYLFSDEKTDGGASLRYARVSVEDGEILLMTTTREPRAATSSPTASSSAIARRSPAGSVRPA